MKYCFCRYEVCTCIMCRRERDRETETERRDTHAEGKRQRFFKRKGGEKEKT